MAKQLVLIGIILVIIGLCWPLLSKLPFGRLPGDIVIRRDNFSFYFPLTTCIIISLVITLLFRLFRK